MPVPMMNIVNGGLHSDAPISRIYDCSMRIAFRKLLEWEWKFFIN